MTKRMIKVCYNYEVKGHEIAAVRYLNDWYDYADWLNQELPKSPVTIVEWEYVEESRPTALTVAQLKEWLTVNDMEGLVKDDWKVAVWIKGTAFNLEDVTAHEPTLAGNDRDDPFIAFHLAKETGND